MNEENDILKRAIVSLAYAVCELQEQQCINAGSNWFNRFMSKFGFDIEK